jgi:hypothetical protein
VSFRSPTNPAGGDLLGLKIYKGEKIQVPFLFCYAKIKSSGDITGVKTVLWTPNSAKLNYVILATTQNNLKQLLLVWYYSVKKTTPPHRCDYN